MAHSITEARGRLNHRYRTSSLAKPTTVYVALHTADPTRADLANEFSPGVNGYSRAAVTVGDAFWSAPVTAGGQEIITNVNSLAFGTATANLGTVTHFSVRTASTGGDMLDYGPLGTPRLINSGDPITAPSGALVIGDA